MDYRNQHVVVTGGSKGVGEALAREATKRGAKVSILARGEADLKRVAHDIGATPHVINLGDPDDVATAVERIEGAAGPIDVLINNAAVVLSGPFTSFSPERIQLELYTDLIAPITLTHQVLPGMLERNRGAIVNISSAAGEFVVRNLTNYAAAKGGLDHFTFNLQRELRKTPIRTMLVVLGEIDTPAREAARSDAVVDAVGNRIGIMGTQSPQHVANRLLDSLAKGKRAISVPPAMTPLIQFRQIPSRIMDALLIGID